MATVRIEHSVSDFDAWKGMFDRDPADRKGSGVRHYRISRPVDDPAFVMIDLDFDSVEAAQGFVTIMRGIWAGPGKDIMHNPVAWVVDVVEAAEV